MMKTLYVILPLLLNQSLFSQKIITGKVVNENHIPLGNTLVINIATNQQSTTDNNGAFNIRASEDEELRFVKYGYERVAYKVSPKSFNNELNITLLPSYKEIEEVKLSIKTTGNIKEDLKQFKPNKNLEQLKLDLFIDYKKTPYSYYRKSKLENPMLFTQPKGEGFSLGKVNNKWTLLDLLQILDKELGEDYFKELNINYDEKDAFIYFVLKDFDTKDILKYGRFTPNDLVQFMILAEQKRPLFQKK
ncbi:hypothetical protein D1J36_003760 [Riemerella anatipestifer]|uniref:carboxypeptidase-like regulatory domain-containing protein n=1 Tax=Riemerella anatipestifer TaxID=34085 RepID=UPI0016297397|nr:carboxypeptidase-like regulatory domain-containing protein [Riemerella anatipestifer]USL96229.1 hypothetical protein D1J36_003760 [Riemerella anatipestifer]